MHGHFWTIAPHFVDTVFTPKTPGISWTTTVSDSRYSSVELSGFLDEVEGANAIVLIVHGMCSTAEVPYVIMAGRDARKVGLSSLRLNLRGADRCGQDIYHAGLVEDIEATIASAEVQKYETVYVLGFSLGGHVAMRYGLNPGPKVRRIVSLCAPLDLSASCQHIDKLRQRVYRRHLMTGLKECARASELHREMELSHVGIESIRTMREWDSRVVAPRFGFRNAEDYYQQMSMGPRLADMRVPALLVFAEKDPMVAAQHIRPSLRGINDQTEVRWLSGGHVCFPAKLKAVESAMHWLTE
ncbi:MAG: alpha/beta fold hydrolase [Kofleriaceae bacterium]|nr:alpha/beta fold hydrolase [Kofleriaceae bacterium]